MFGLMVLLHDQVPFGLVLIKSRSGNICCKKVGSRYLVQNWFPKGFNFCKAMDLLCTCSST